MKFKVYKNINYVKILESEDEKQAIYLRRRGKNNYFINHIFYGNDGIGLKENRIKDNITDKGMGLRTLTALKKELEAQLKESAGK